MTIGKLKLTLDNAQREFVYRIGTDDEVVIAQSLAKRAYDPGRLRRGAELLDFYESLAASDRPPLDCGCGCEHRSERGLFRPQIP